MPKRPPRHRPLVDTGRPKHSIPRPSAAARGYGRRWRRLRAWYLARHPICELAGCLDPATDVDHIVAKARGGGDELNNLQALCHRHHSQKTALRDGGLGRRASA